MDKVGQLFHKWQGWIKHGLMTEFQHLLHDQRIFNAYLESLNPYVGQIEGAEIAQWWQWSSNPGPPEAPMVK